MKCANGIPGQTEVITPVPGQARSRYLRDCRAAGGGKYKYEVPFQIGVLPENTDSSGSGMRYVRRVCASMFAVGLA